MIYKYLELVGLNREHANRFVHEFSGGQRQRIGIARALAVQPEFIVLDEPISALDVSIQAQIVNLLVDLQKKMGLTYLLVAHDLSMVKHISDRVAVLYLGTLVELTTSEELYANPRHPYTQALLSAIPIPDPKVEAERDRKKIRLEGEVPSPINTKPGCKFQGRCKYAKVICRQQMPELKDCHFRIACDVTNPLCGENGSTYIYGPQKGVTVELRDELDHAMGAYAQVVKAYNGTDYAKTPGAGAAGGLGFAFLSFLSGELLLLWSWWHPSFLP